MKTTLRKFGRYLGYAVTLILIVLVAYGAVEYALGSLPYLVVGDSPSSMSPSINYGDLTINYAAPFSSLKVGDIIVFHDPRGDPSIITHRIVGITTCGGQECFITKGDNNSTNPIPDAWRVTQSSYIGEVILVVPYLGFISPTMWGFHGYLVLLPLGFVLLLVLFIAAWESARKEGRPAPAPAKPDVTRDEVSHEKP